MKIRTKIGMSLDGFMASADGWPAQAKLDTFIPGESHGLDEFLEQCQAVIIGRNTFDFGYQFWADQSNWAWEGMQVYVLTSSPLPDALPEGVTGSADSAAGLLEQLRAADLQGDVHLVGGKRTIQAFQDIGAIDQLGILVLPILLGDGARLFDQGAPQTSMHLQQHRGYPDGTVELIYGSE